MAYSSFAQLEKSVGNTSVKTSGSAPKGSFLALEKAIPQKIIEQIRTQSEEENRIRKEKQARLEKVQQEADKYFQEAQKANSFTGLAKETIKGLNPFTQSGRSNIYQGGVAPILSPIETSKKIGTGFKNMMTENATNTAFDVFQQSKLDKQNLETIQQNNNKVLELRNSLRETQDESEKNRILKHIGIYAEFNKKLAEETGGELKNKTNAQLVGQSIGTAFDLTPFLGAGSLGINLGLKGLGKLGLKSATSQLTKNTGGRILGKALPQTQQALTRSAMKEGGFFGGASGLSGEMQNKEADYKSLAMATVGGSIIGVALAGLMSKIIGNIGPRLPKKDVSNIEVKDTIDEISSITQKPVTPEDTQAIFDAFSAGATKQEIVDTIGIEQYKAKLEAPQATAPIVDTIEQQVGRPLTIEEQKISVDGLKEGKTPDVIAQEIIAPVKPVEKPAKPSKLTQEAPKVEKAPEVPEKTAETKTEDKSPLHAEARKYNSAEEFANSEDAKSIIKTWANRGNKNASYQDPALQQMKNAARVLSEMSDEATFYMSPDKKIAYLSEKESLLKKYISGIEESKNFSGYKTVINSDGFKKLSQLTDIWKEAHQQKPVKVPKPEVKPATEVKEKKPRESETAKKTSQYAKDIELRALEKKLEVEFGNLAEYTPQKRAEQAKVAAELMMDRNKTLDVLYGDAELPTGLSPNALSLAIDNSMDTELINALKNSKIASDVSQGASNLSMSVGRNAESPVKTIRDIENAKIAKKKNAEAKAKEGARLITEKINKRKAVTLKKAEDMLEALICK